MDTVESQDRPRDDSTGHGGLALVSAVVILVAVGAMTFAMYRAADDAGVTDTVWGRWIYLFSTVEALAFAAAGWVFGRQVSRSAEQSANDKAVDEAKRADAATADQEAGRELAAAVRASVGTTMQGTDAVVSTYVDNLVSRLLDR